MVVLNTAVNRIRDLLNADIYKGQLGTTGTTPDKTQTALFTPIAITQRTFEKTTADKSISLLYTLPSTDGNGNTFREFAVQLNSALVTFNRVTFTDLEKFNTDEIVVSTLVLLDNP